MISIEKTYLVAWLHLRVFKTIQDVGIRTKLFRAYFEISLVETQVKLRVIRFIFSVVSLNNA
jgi:hypothetical protein